MTGRSEALLRAEALWRSWEAHRLDPERGIAVRLRDFADSQLAALLRDRPPSPPTAPTCIPRGRR
ncbi:MAG: DUF4913 domain-containing protein [Frankiaceae bacterium]